MCSKSTAVDKTKKKKYRVCSFYGLEETSQSRNGCYFCMTNVTGFSSKSKGNIKYPDLPLAIRPIPHSADLPPPLFTSLPELVDEPVSSTSEGSTLEDDCYNPLADKSPNNDYSSLFKRLSS